MSEYAPDAIRRLFDTIHDAIPQAVLSGIVGDSAHTYGYHRGRDFLPSSDYSVQLAEDRQGDGQAASALDISWSGGDWQRIVSQRLMDAAHDSRMSAAREFYGTTDGQTVCGWDYVYGRSGSSDSSHLWHIHLSILRQYANDPWAMDRIASVIIGSGEPGPLHHRRRPGSTWRVSRTCDGSWPRKSARRSR